MTDEKKTPEEDEVTDEQLKDVAGGTNVCITPGIKDPVAIPLAGNKTVAKTDPMKESEDTGDVTGSSLPDFRINSLDDGITRL